MFSVKFESEVQMWGWEGRWCSNYFLKFPMILISCLPLWLRNIKFNIKQFSHKTYWHQGPFVSTYTHEVLPHVACVFVMSCSPKCSVIWHGIRCLWFYSCLETGCLPAEFQVLLAALHGLFWLHCFFLDWEQEGTWSGNPFSYCWGTQVCLSQAFFWHTKGKLSLIC